MRQLHKATAVVGAALLTAPALSYGQDQDLGKRVYVSRCAVCHGVSGKGDGPFAAQLKAHVADLTQIQKNNGGTIVGFGNAPDRGLIIVPDGLTILHRDLTIAAANQSRLPAVFAFRTFAINGGLMSWGMNFSDIYRQAATYVDRILRGAKPENLPVQAPTKFDLVINLKTAKALGLTIPPSLLAIADDVIE